MCRIIEDVSTKALQSNLSFSLIPRVCADDVSMSSRQRVNLLLKHDTDALSVWDEVETDQRRVLTDLELLNCQ